MKIDLKISGFRGGHSAEDKLADRPYIPYVNGSKPLLTSLCMI
jgi:hypothetical protein